MSSCQAAMTTWSAFGNAFLEPFLSPLFTSARSTSTSSAQYSLFLPALRYPPGGLQLVALIRLFESTDMRSHPERCVSFCAGFGPIETTRFLALSLQVSLVHSLAGHISGVISLALTASGDIISGGWEGHARVWDVSTGRCKFVLEGHENGEVLS
jgi:WD40 repeat protein